MKKMVTYCGLVCTDCEAYKATQNNDDKLRKEVAEKWSKEYHHEFRPEDIICDGCLPDTVKVIGHLDICPIRKCGMTKGVKNCGWCPDYSCNNTEEFFKMVPDCRKTLDAVKKSIR